MKPKRIGYDDLTVCNCCQCGRLLLGERMARQLSDGRIVTRVLTPPKVYTRIEDRPYCGVCGSQANAGVK